jgi:hypothetical protein
MLFLNSKSAEASEGTVFSDASLGTTGAEVRASSSSIFDADSEAGCIIDTALSLLVILALIRSSDERPRPPLGEGETIMLSIFFTSCGSGGGDIIDNGGWTFFSLTDGTGRLGGGAVDEDDDRDLASTSPPAFRC